MKKLLTYDDTAEWLGVTRRTVEKLKATGVLPAVIVGDRSVRFEEDAVKQYVESKRTGDGDGAVGAILQRALDRQGLPLTIDDPETLAIIGAILRRAAAREAA